MSDEITIGPVPAEEPCQQVGTTDYNPVRARAECQRYIELLRKKFGHEPEGARLRIASSAHDFGTYYEVAVRFDDTNREAVEYAYRIEANSPATWDDDAPFVEKGKQDGDQSVPVAPDPTGAEGGR